jgi:hypothetical protein
LAEDTATLTRKSEEIYRRHVSPLEQEHSGKYIAVTEAGEVVLAPTLSELIDKAERELSPGNFLFRVGDLAIDTWR